MACGNYASDAGSKDRSHKQALYACGLDSMALRCQLRHAGLKVSQNHGKAKADQWTAAGSDIKTALLNAPLNLGGERVILLRPPAVMVRNGWVSPQEIWRADGAIYGLIQSPSAWSHHRDSRVPRLQVQVGEQGFRLVQSKSDPNIWILRRQLPDGALGHDIEAVVGIYVDDLLVTGPRSKVDAVLDAFRALQNIHKPKIHM